MKSQNIIDWENCIRKIADISVIIKKLQELKDYLNNNLWRKYIQYFINEAEYSVIFVSKKDEK